MSEGNSKKAKDCNGYKDCNRSCILPHNYWSHVFSLAYPVNEFSLKEMRTWCWWKIALIVFIFGVNPENY